MRRLLAIAIATLTGSGAIAQDNYPARQVTVVVPFSPGASNDIIGRHLAGTLAKRWGKPVVVENRPGAGSAIGVAYVARSAPDGHTLLFISSAYTTLVATAPTKDLGFDPARDILPAAMAALGEFIMTTGPSTKAANLTEFIAEAKTRGLFAGTTGINSGSHFAAEAFSAATGVNLDMVHYKGGNEAGADLVAGRVDAYFGTVAYAAPLVKQGRMKAMAIVSPSRSSLLPAIPTITEAGYKDAEFSSWWGVFVPGRTPAALVDRLNGDINTLMATAESRKFLEDIGAIPNAIPAAQFRTMVNEETERWKKLVEKIKAKEKK